MPAFLRHVPTDPADHPDHFADPAALGGMFETARAPLPEHRLWQAVLLVALADATAPRNGRNGFDRREARDWLDAGGPHFALVCELAGLNPARVRSRWRDLRRLTLPPHVFRAACRTADQ